MTQSETADSINLEQWQIKLPDAASTKHLGHQLGQLPAGTILLLEGNLGSGKTTLVQGIGTALQIGEPIVSPTFTLVCEYLEGRIPLYHLDLYRLQPEEVDQLDLEAYWEEADPGIVAIEWPERLNYLPSEYIQISLQPTETGRLAILKPIGSSQQQNLRQVLQVPH